MEPLRRSVLFATLGQSCVLPRNLEAAAELFEACRRALGKCPTIVATVDAVQIQSSGGVDAGRNSTCPMLASMHTHIGTRDQAAGRIAALQVLLEATQRFAEQHADDRVRERFSAHQVAEQRRGDACRAAAHRKALLEVYDNERLARGANGMKILRSSGAVGAEGEPPVLETAGTQPGRCGRVVCPAAGADGVFVTPDLRLQEGVGTREGTYVIRFRVCTADPSADANRPGR